jgi:hypothetical protein
LSAEREAVLLALLVADKVITENNGKKGIIGIFNQFNFKELPVTCPPWFIFASIAGLATGKHDITFNLTHDRTQHNVFSIGGEMDVKERGNTDLQIQIGNARFEKPGEYNLTLHVDGSYLGGRVINVQSQKEA